MMHLDMSYLTKIRKAIDSSLLGSSNSELVYYLYLPTLFVKNHNMFSINGSLDQGSLYFPAVSLFFCVCSFAPD